MLVIDQAAHLPELRDAYGPVPGETPAALTGQLGVELDNRGWTAPARDRAETEPPLH